MNDNQSTLSYAYEPTRKESELPHYIPQEEPKIPS